MCVNIGVIGVVMKTVRNPLETYVGESYGNSYGHRSRIGVVGVAKDVKITVKRHSYDSYLSPMVSPMRQPAHSLGVL